MRATIVPVCTGDSSALRPRNDNKYHLLLVILGPTSSGKSDLAVEIAKYLSNKTQINSNLSQINYSRDIRDNSRSIRESASVAEIISADSRQVYRGMDLGTGKITKKEMRGIPHHLLDVASPKRRFTVAQYKKLAQKAIKDIQKRGKIPILCGGTGLYIQAVVDDSQIPAVKPDFGLRAELEKKSVAELFAILQKLDPARAANIDPKNPRRLIRAIEIVKTTGKPVPKLNSPYPPLETRGGITPPFSKSLSRVQRGKRLGWISPSLDSREGRGEFNPLFLGIKKSPAELKKLIYKRLLKRFKQGMIKEVSDLNASGLSWKRLESFGLEYRWLARFLQKKISRKEMIERLQKESEHYAKRQMTWFKRDPRVRWVKNKKQALGLVKKFLKK